jgi:predicted hydrocarbon binding protein
MPDALPPQTSQTAGLNDAGLRLPNSRVRRLLLGIEDVMGASGLATIVRQAGQTHYSINLPPDNHRLELPATEYAALIQAIENYYGRGARGTLTRIGASTFKELVKSRPWIRLVHASLSRFLPRRQQQRWVLDWLARNMGGQVTVERHQRRLRLIDHTSAATLGRRRETEICWLTQGEIMEALQWATGREHAVTESACKAKGDPVCQFEIGEAFGS